MPKKAEKLEELKIRLTKEDKQLIKNAAAVKGITMTQFILDMAIPTAKRQLEFVQHKDIVLNRIEKTEGNINKLKGNMQQRKNKNKKTIKSIFARKS